MVKYKFASSFAFAALYSLLCADVAVAEAENGLRVQQQTHQEEHARSLQDVGDIVLVAMGQDTTFDVTIDTDAVTTGALSYGSRVVSVQPLVTGGNTEVKCTATLDASGVDMQIYFRKARRPDTNEDGEASEFDCEGNSDMNLIAPDVETCMTTNFPSLGDLLLGYVVIFDNGLTNKGKTYQVTMRCNRSTPSCFSKDDTVQVLGQGATQMDQLAVGDRILVGDQYEPVYGFAHWDKNTAASFLQIDTIASTHNNNNNYKPLEVTGDHLVQVKKQMDAKAKYIPAKEIQVGDSLFMSGASAKVTKITSTQPKKGLYAPLTPSGTLLVNGIQTSSYISLLDDKNDASVGNWMVAGMDSGLSYHWLNHVALSPIRIACLGIYQGFCDTKYIDEDTGYPPFVSLWFQLVQFFQAQNNLGQVLLALVFLAILGPLYILESMVRGGAASIGVALIAAAGLGAFALQRRRGWMRSSVAKAKIL